MRNYNTDLCLRARMIYNKEILRLAVPSIVQNVTVPLLGLVDLAIVGHMGATSYIAAVSIGTMIFNVMYWLLGFLRMGTSGMTAQALGRRDLWAVVSHLRQGLLVGLSIALCFIVLQLPLRSLALFTMLPDAQSAVGGGEAMLAQHVTTYFNICIWGAPAMLCLYVLNGWYIGMQNTRVPMVVAIVQNVVNILVSLCLVYGFGMKIAGVATGTLVAQWTGLVVSLLLCKRFYGRLSAYWKDPSGRRHGVSMGRFFAVNRDIFLRTVCMVGVNLFFTVAGSWQGEVILAVNTLLMTLFMLFSYFMDGFAFAGEALAGRFYGARNFEAFRTVCRELFVWGGGMIVLFTALYAFGGTPFLHLLTDDEAVIAASEPYFWWAVLVPLTGMAAFVYDGIFIGITAARGMLVSCAIATAAFFGLYFVLFPMFGNHALWIALLVYLALRGIVQAGWMRIQKEP